MNRKTTFGQKVLRFLDGKGFYLAVLVCLTAVGLSAWFVTRSPADNGDDPVGGSVSVDAPVGGLTDPDETLPVGSDDPMGEDNHQSVSGEADLPVTAPPISDGPSVSTGEEEENDPVSGDTQEEEVTAPAPLVYTWPVKGEVLSIHSGDSLLYDETMGDWRVHEGIDIAASLGTTVKACAAGTVSAILQDGLMGTTVVIDHGEDMVSVYANLQSLPAVAVGDEVYTGDIIGAVGKTAIAESALGSHLHFELTCDGSPVDPMEYLPKT